MLTKKDKENILEMLKMVDVKEMELDHPNDKYVKWYRFGGYNALQIVSEIIKGMPEKKK